MKAINMLEARSSLSRWLEAVESGAEKEIVIARNGRPAARLALSSRPAAVRVGIAKGLFDAPDEIGANNTEVAKLFGVTGA
jgi:antitoxin (DNA-binding transcriptional repressor) of toxin-antitoxin stability system